MADHNELGYEGETAAADYLTRRGYTVLHTNWYSGHEDLDIVARRDNLVVVVEVKTRRDSQYGEPYYAVDELKRLRLSRAADAYVRMYRLDCPVRFDIITVVGPMPPFRIHHIPDAFYPPVG